jgi:Uncharacterized conserved protein (DUF2203)
MVTARQHWQDRSISCLRLWHWLGEPDVSHWHQTDEGFGSRRPLAELPTGRGSGSPA